MLRIEDLKAGLALVGLEPSVIATVSAVAPISEDSIQVIYKTLDGTLKDRLLGRADEENISIAMAERPGRLTAMVAPSNGQSKPNESTWLSFAIR